MEDKHKIANLAELLSYSLNDKINAMIRFISMATFATALFCSCAVPKAVTFTADASVFADTMEPVQTMSFDETLGLSPRIQTIDLFEESVSTAYINRPVYFQKRLQQVLIYPGDQIQIKGDDENYIFSTVNKNQSRDRELLVFNSFIDRESWPRFNVMIDYSLQDVLDFEAQRKMQLVLAEEAAQKLFDSLCKVYDVSKKFKKLTKNYVPYRYGLGPLSVYKLYRDTLMAHNLYWSKVKSLLPVVNAIKDVSAFTPNLQTNLYELYLTLFPVSGFWNTQDETEFRERFGNVENSFTGLARDYLLSRLLYTSYVKNINIPKSYLQKYRSYSVSKEFRKMVRKARRQQAQLEKHPKTVPNELLLPDGQSKTTLEAVLSQHKGRYVLVDLWATWCVPCREEMPYLEQLEQKYPKDKISFIRITTESNAFAWRKYLFRNNEAKDNQYLLLDSSQTALDKEINLTTIPRYLLFDREGKMINSDAPRPSDPALSALLDKCLNVHQ